MAENHNHTQGEVPEEELLALLKYMADHNKHHSEELQDLSHSADDKVKILLYEAVKDLESSTEKIYQAIKLLEK